MPRIARNNLNTSFFHVMSQGIDKEYIFKEKVYKKTYFEILKQANLKYQLKIISYCIMDNHVHLLIYSEKIKEISKFMKEVNENFARYYNYKMKRVGYVFRNRFISEPIYNQKYLRNCLVYIHNNPVKARMVNKCIDYNFSSYKDYLNNSNFINNETIELVFNTKKLDLKEFYNMHLNNFYFVDCEDTTEVNLQEIIQEYLQKENKELEDMEEKEELVLHIKERIKVSNRQLARVLKIDRNKVDRILKNKGSD